MNEVDYLTKVQDHFSDSNTYESRIMIFLPPLRDIVIRFLKTLHDRNLLTKSNYLNLFANSSTLPLFYALEKLMNCVMRNPSNPADSFIYRFTFI